MILPSDPDAERSILGLMLVSGRVAAQMSDILTAADFDDPNHAEVFDALLAVQRRGDKPDPILLADELDRRETILDVGGKPFIHSLIESADVPSSAPRYARIVQNHARLRDLVGAAEDVKAMALSNPEDVEKTLAAAEARIFEATNAQLGGDKHQPVAVEAELDSVMASLESDSEREQGIGFNIGITEFDEMTAGIQEGRYICIGAGTSKGKTSLCSQIGLAGARAERVVLHATLEMPKRQIIKRLLAQSSDVPVHALNNPQLLEEKHWTSLSKTVGRLPRGYIVVDGEMNLDVLMAKVKRTIARFGRIDVLIIDYIQLVKGVGRFSTRTEEVGSVSRALKGLANETGITVIAAAQLNRKNDDEKRRPRLGDLRESGSLEQDPDIVLLLHHVTPSKKEPEENLKTLVPVEFIVAKNRDGPTGLVKASFDAPRNLFMERLGT